MKLIPPTEAAARARAAIAYSGMEVLEVCDKTGIAEGTLRRLLQRTNPSGGTLERLYAIADTCSVPRDFMEQGWEVVAGVLSGDPETFRQRLETLEGVVAEMAQHLHPPEE